MVYDIALPSDLSACLFALPVLAEQGSHEKTTEIAEIDFACQIRLILAKKCLSCHGPDEVTREADLRLDTEPGSRADFCGYQPIIPGNPDESELMLRITSEDEEERGCRRSIPIFTLDDNEIELLRQWIKSGGEYRTHCSFIAPERPALPKIENVD